jgi:tetratricopeptide (TPR) repeat protein
MSVPGAHGESATTGARRDTGPRERGASGRGGRGDSRRGEPRGARSGNGSGSDGGARDASRGRPGRGSGPRKGQGRDVARDGRADAGGDSAARGPRLAPKQGHRPDPAIDEDVTGFEIDRTVKNELRTLSKDNAKGVGQHLVMVARLLDVDVVAARAHAETAVRRAGRVAAVRETRGLVAYREGDFQLALSEFRTARRLSGSQHLLPLMVDCERGLGRPERALELAGSPEARTLGKAERLELLIVCSGIRRDMGDLDAAVVLLETPELNPNRRAPWSARLFYAYAEALLARGDRGLARAWFAEAADADAEAVTDAAERLDELDGIVFVDLGEDDTEDSAQGESEGSVEDPTEDPAQRAPEISEKDVTDEPARDAVDGPIGDEPQAAEQHAKEPAPGDAPESGPIGDEAQAAEQQAEEPVPGDAPESGPAAPYDSVPDRPEPDRPEGDAP